MDQFDLQLCDYDDVYANGISSNGSIDLAFRKINRNSTAFIVWRIENMNVVAVPREQYGIFYDTDSYIIFASSTYGQQVGVETVSREIKGSLLVYHIHFWLGCATTPDKSGVAAYKTVELDNFLNSSATQHRETQGNESARFKSYFKSGLKILKPDNINDPTVPKLYKIRGKRTPILTQLDRISWEKFNSSEIFLLHTQKFLFVWVGRAANAAEKLNASKISKEMKEQYNVPNVAFMDDGYEKTLQDDEKKEFNKCLPLDKRHVLPENATNTEANGNYRKSTIKLYKCSENNGKYRVTEIKNGPLRQGDLDQEDVFIIDRETDGIWVWVGKRVGDKERGEALRNARGFVKKKKYPNDTKVTRVVDGSEPVEFKVMFSSWKSEGKIAGKGAKLVSKLDALTMEERPSLAAETQLIDDGSGMAKVWRIKQHSIVEVPKERHGFFFSGDCYIVLYSYETDSASQQKHLLYYWLGSHATQEDITNAATKAAEIDEELGGLGFQSRIIQGCEPPHFLQIFKGKLIIFKGKGSDFDESGRNLKHPMQYFLQIYGSTLATSKGVQIHPKASQLDANYCFVLKRGKHAHIWCGNYSTGDQREIAKLFAGKDFELVLEGKEKPEFFDLLGGKSAYLTQLVKNDDDPRPPRLFHCTKTNSTDALMVDEIFFFHQTDLLPEDVMLLDYHHVLYLWIGKLSSKEDQRHALQTAMDYLQTDPCGREMNIPVIQINQGYEPPTFTGFFPTWNKQLWKNHKSFVKIRQEIERANTKGTTTGLSKNGYGNQKSGHSDFDQYDKYPMEILKEPNEKLPARVDPLHKELHLTHDDFVSILKMTYLEFEKFPRWKQQELKKRVGLF